MDQFLQHVLNGVVLGGTYALLGIGLTLIFGIMRVVNFTHGELYAFGAYLTYLFVALLHLDFFVSILLAAMLGFALGALIEFVLLRPLSSADTDTVMLVMIGAWIAMQNAEQFVWGGVAKLVPSPFAQEPLVIGPVSVLPLRLFVLAATLLNVPTIIHEQNGVLGRANRFLAPRVRAIATSYDTYENKLVST